MIYEVKGSDETVENVDILGEVRKVGERIELDEEVAAPLVEEGKLEFVEEKIVDSGEEGNEALGNDPTPGASEGSSVLAEAGFSQGE